jgi:hypothetical protein
MKTPLKSLTSGVFVMVRFTGEILNRRRDQLRER